MAKYAKVYNKETEEWEILNPYKNNHSLSGSTNASDVIVDNPHYTDENGDNVTLNDALSDISENIYELRRNVSWLAEHKGTGGGGGGGPIVDYNYKIKVLGVNENNEGIANIKDSIMTVTFYIENHNGKTFDYKVYYDNNLIEASSITGSAQRTVKGEVSLSNEHLLTIIATENESGYILPQFNAKLTQSMIEISVDNKEMPCVINENTKVMINVTNTLRNTETALIFTCDEVEDKQFEHIFKNTSVDYTDKVVLDWFTEDGTGISNGLGIAMEPNFTYTIHVYADDDRAGLSNTETFRVTMTQPGKITMSDLVGLAKTPTMLEENEDYKTPFESSLSFSFTTYLDVNNNTEKPYYAVVLAKRLDSGAYVNSKMLSGVYYGDKNLDVEGKAYFDNNQTGGYGLPTVFNFKLTNSEFSDFEGYCRITVRCWDKNGNFTQKNGYFELTKDGQIYIEWINPEVSNGRRACLARWDKDVNYPKTATEKIWTSHMTNYANFQNKIKIVDGKQVLDNEAKIGMNLVNTVGSPYSGFIDNKLKLSSHAYGEINLSDYREEIKYWGVSNSECSGFTISVTFNASDLANKDKVIFYAGNTNSVGNLSNGIKITLNNVIWRIGGSTINFIIRTECLYTIDFVYDNKKNQARLYVNGKLSKAANTNELNENDILVYEKMYLSRQTDNGIFKTGSNSNAYFYNLSIYSIPMPDDAVVINGKNARLTNQTDESVKNEYINWKFKNFLSFNENTSLYESLIYDKYNGYKNIAYSDLINQSPISVLEIDATMQSCNFNLDYYFGDNQSSAPCDNVTVNFKYIDKEAGIDEEQVSIPGCSVAIQGTSTKNYNIKNLELYTYMFGSINSEDRDEFKPRLWQVKPEWFPESEFTLKADIVDSAHVNNAIIGKWVNDNAAAIGFEKNPAQQAMDYVVNKEYVNRPMVYDSNLKPVTDDDGLTLRHNEPTIKHTIEGFPVIVVVKFNNDKDKGMQISRVLGIFSFNLGRHSHYNLGLRFLKGYHVKGNKLSKVIESNEYEVLGKDEKIYYTNGKSFTRNDIYSYEFNANGDQSSEEYPVWSQSDETVIKAVGDFTFNGAADSDWDLSSAPSSNIYTNLSNLFSITDKMSYLIGVTGKYTFNNTDSNYVYDGFKTAPSETDFVLAEKLNNALALNNASSYFTICVALGLTDSLGKNFVLRTWGKDVSDSEKGNDNFIPKWWPSFYDMDTALGVNNSGTQDINSDDYIDKYVNIPKYAYTIDGVEYETDDLSSVPNGVTPTKRVNQVKVYLNYKGTNGEKPNFSCYNSALWNIMRHEAFDGPLRSVQVRTYQSSWEILRKNTNGTDKLLYSPDNFVRLMEVQMKDCGELLFNFDYNNKYLYKFEVVKNGNTVTLNKINGQQMDILHGDRVEYVRQWLDERLNFFDGIFMVSYLNNNNISTSNFNSNCFKLAVITAEGYGNIPEFINPILNITTSSPIIFSVFNQNANSSNSDLSNSFTYYIPKNTPTDIVLPPQLTGSNGRKMTFNYSNIITNIKKLQNIVFSKLVEGSLPKMAEIDVSDIKQLGGTPFDFTSNFITTDKVSGELVSNLENINFSGSDIKPTTDSIVNVNIDLSGQNGKGELYNYNNIDSIDISRSCVTNLLLPKTPINSLNIIDSKIPKLELTNQHLLKNILFNGCNELSEIIIDKCDGFTELAISSLPSINSITIKNCNNLSKLSITKNKLLNSIVIENCPLLADLNLSENEHESLSISMNGNTSSLTNVNLSKTKCKTIKWGDATQLGNLSYLNIKDCVFLESFIFDGIENDDDVLNLEPFTSLAGSNLILGTNNFLKNIRVGKKEQYFNATIKTNGYGLFSNLISLERVYGYINICSPSTFYKSNKFKLNESYEIIGDKDGVNDIVSITPKHSKGDKYCTYIKFDDSLKDTSSMFADTKCSPNDILYVLRFCDNITKMNNMFENCYYKGINNDESCDYRYLFSHCKNVTDMSSFMNISNNKIDTSEIFDVHIFSTIIDSENRYNGTFSFLSKINNIDQLFSGHYVIYNNENTYDGTWLFDNKENPDGGNLNINRFYRFSFNKLMRRYDNFNSKDFLSGLPKLEYIEDSFNDMPISMSFDDGIDENGNKMDDYVGCKLFFYNTELKEIKSSFNFNMYGIQLSNRYQEITNLFGGDLELTRNGEEYKDKYPRKLEVIENSFNFPIVYEDITIDFKITNNTLSTLTELKSVSGGLLTQSFSGPALNKYCVNEIPFDILKNNKKINSFQFFFNGLDVVDDNGKHIDNVFELPGTLFVDENGEPRSENLKYVDGTFYNVKFSYSLTPKRFEKSNIESVSYLFAKEIGSNKTGGLAKPIPFDLFYNTDTYGRTKKIIKNVEGLFRGIGNNIGNTIMDYNASMMDTVETAVKNGFLIEDNGRYIWNIFKSDGNGNNYHNAIKNSGAIKNGNVQQITDSDFDECLKENYYDMSNNVIDANNTGNYENTIRSFLCPSDILYYCDPEYSINCESLFSYSDCFCGTIPPMLFEPIPKTTRLISVFRGCKKIKAFKNSTRNSIGIMYPDRLFKKLTNLDDISLMFSLSIVAPNASITKDLFSNNTKLTNVSGLWEGTTWLMPASYYPENAHLQDLLCDGLFDKHSFIMYASSMFNGGILNIKMHKLFNPEVNKNLIQVGSYLNGVSNLFEGGTVDKFWEFDKIDPYKSSAAYFINKDNDVSYQKYFTNISDDDVYNNTTYFTNEI